MRSRLVPGVVFLAAATAVAQQPSFTFPQLLSRVTDGDWLWRAAPAGERCVQFSSYDRSSDKGPGDTEAWYGNGDCGQYLRVEARDGHDEHVMVDVDGPGVLTRLWSANPSGELWFDIDGARAWTVDFQALTTGKLAPVVEPLAGLHSRGANCFLPIPFQKHLRIAASKGDFYYHCDVVRLPPGTAVPSFRPEFLQQFGAEIAAAAKQLATPVAVGPWHGTSMHVPAGTLLAGLEVAVEKAAGQVDLGEVLRRVLLVVRCGDEETVRVPVLDFFCGGADWKPWRSARLGITESGVGYCRWPMPMPDGGDVSLLTEGDLQGVGLQLGIAPAALPAGVAPLRFRASYHQEKGFPSRPYRDHLVLAASGGPGRFVGCSLLVKNPTRGWWGEGDEKFWVDGEAFPSWFGTGTEDYFGYAWCDPHPFQSAFHAQVQCDGPGNYGFTAVHRTHQFDSVPFEKSFRFDLEVWHWVPELKIDYASVAYWYGAPGSGAGLPPVPAVAQRTLDRLPPPPVFVVPGAIEGEGLKVLSCSGGEHEVQDLSFREKTFSHDAQRWWKHGVVGDTLVLALPVAEAGEYRITAGFCKAVDYGIVQCEVGGAALGAPFDGFAPHVSGSGPVELGTTKLGAGEVPFTLRIVGKNEKAVPAHMVGLDYLKLEKMR